MELSSLFEDFRAMCNDAIRIAAEEKPENRFKLIEAASPKLKQYNLHSHYLLSACEVAYSIYRNKHPKSTPYLKRAFLKLDNQSYRLNHILLRIPFHAVGKGHHSDYILIVLRSTRHGVSFVDDASLKRGSVTVTPSSVVIAFSKEVEPFEPSGFMGVDINERNATAVATDGWARRFDELAEVAEIKERYKEIRAGVSRKTRGDRRIARRLLSRCGTREKNRTVSRIHKVTKTIVDCAREHRLGVKMEKLKGIRKRYRKGNGQGGQFRGRMNSWVYGETQRQIDYKSEWVGVPHWYVNPRGTSSYCLCGSRVVRLADRKLYCPKCDKIWDRDDLASRNIMACAVPQARPSRRSDEVERGGDCSNPLSRWREGNTLVDATGRVPRTKETGEKRGTGDEPTSACQS